MNNHHTTLYNSTDNKSSVRVFKQELISYEETEYGLKITKLERSFTNEKHFDCYTSKPMVLQQRKGIHK